MPCMEIPPAPLLCALKPNPSLKLSPTACHAGHQALGLRPILRLLSSASHRRCQLSSNVRPRTTHASRPWFCRGSRGARVARGRHSACIYARSLREQLRSSAHYLPGFSPQAAVRPGFQPRGLTTSLNRPATAGRLGCVRK